MKKRCICILLVLSMLFILGPIPASALAGETFIVDGISYHILSEHDTSGIVEVGTGGYGTAVDTAITTSAVIPPSVSYNGKTYAVTAIGEYAFAGCTSMKSIVFPNSIKSIGNEAFVSCVALEQLDLLDSVTTIGKKAFAHCNALKSLTVGMGITAISDLAFYECASLESVIVPGSVSSIGANAFDGCIRLQSITLDNGVVSIGEDAFRRCISLTSIRFPESVRFIGAYAFALCEAMQSLVLDCIEAVIGYAAFGNCQSLQSISFGKGAISIGELAFVGNIALKSISFLGRVTNIGTGAFTYCSSLERAVIGNGVDSIEAGAFSNCEKLNEFRFLGNEPRFVHLLAFAENSPNAVAYVPSAAEGYAADSAGKWRGLLVVRYDPPVISSVSVGKVTTLVADCAANLNVEVSGENLNGKQAIIKIKHSNGGVVFESEPISATNSFAAKLSLGAQQMNTPAGLYSVEVVVVGYAGTAQTMLNVVAYNPMWWDASLRQGTYRDAPALEVRFAADEPSRTIGEVYINNVLRTDCVYDNNSIFIPGHIQPDAVVVVKGVRYPTYYPSYRFTFTLRSN